MRKILYPGTFDPIHNGHIDIASRAAELFDELEFVVAVNPEKDTLFSLKNMRGEHNFLRFEENSICVSFDFTNTKKNLVFMSFIDKLCVKYKAIPSIIKDSRLSKKTVENCYIYYQDFKNKLKNYDNKRIYQSAISNKLDL